VIGMATCLVVLIAVELVVFRSGFFMSHAAVTRPDFPLAKLALAARAPETRVLYVGDSTVLTSVDPDVVSEACNCGRGFNAAFNGATPWYISSMTRRLLGEVHPKVVVIGVSPWHLDSGGHFVATDVYYEIARELMSPDEVAGLGGGLQLGETVDAQLTNVWSAYGQRALVKVWLGSLLPGQRYDESRRGFYAPPGTALNAAQLASAIDRLFGRVKEPTPAAPGVMAFSSLITELRARGIQVAIMLPPVHPAGYQQVGTYLNGAEVAVREFAAQRGLPIVDCRALVSPGDFRDLDHLLESGAAKYSTCVGNQLRTLAQD
jgi:hypothetical protein